MKKEIAQRLNRLAEKLPIVFIEKPDVVLMTGEELLLTPYAERQKLDKKKVYEVPIPQYIAVEHKQQLKDAFKRGGFGEVRVYVNQAMNNAGMTLNVC